MRPSVAVIVLTWNGLSYTRKCLSSLFDETSHDNWELIVVDNGSTDGTLEYLRSLDRVKVIENGRNLGFAKGNNVALRQIQSDAIVLNNDIIITQGDWIEKFQEAAYSANDVGAVVCRLVSPDGYLHHAGSFMPTSTFRGQQLGGGQVDVGQHNLVHEVEHGVAAAMYIRKECLDRVHGFDPDYFSYYEDTDFCLRARQEGFRILYTGEVSLLHFQNTSVKVNRANFSEMYEKSRGTFLSKWSGYFQDRYHQDLGWRSWFFTPPGYGNCSRQITVALDEQGVLVRPRFLEPSESGTLVPENEPFYDIIQRDADDPQVEVTFAWGDLFERNEAPVKVGYTMLEVDGLPSEWVRQANRMSEIWVPSAFNEETFAASGVKRPIVKMPLGYDPSYFNPGIKGFRANDRFTFLSIFEWGERKAPELLLRAFNDEFSGDEDVQLVVKTSNRDPEVNIPKQVADLRLRRGRAPMVIDLNRPVPAHQMGAVYRSADAFVFPTRGEGWGYPVMEALACGLPTISTAWSALEEFYDDTVGFPVSHKLVPAQARCTYYKGFSWAEPQLEDLRHQMRWVYEHHAEARQRAAVGAERMRQTYTLDATTRRLRERLVAVAS